MREEDIQRFNKIVSKLQGKKEQGNYEYMALCPAHGDARLSLWIKLQDNGKIHIKCHAGCSSFDVCESLGFKVTILYPVPQIVDCFDYLTVAGELYYQEVKYDATSLERFKVRRQNAKKPNEWIWDTKGISLILYNLFEVMRADKDDIIFMNEGSKDARTLLNLGLISTAALFNDWAKTDTSPLDGKHVIIMVDNDEAGETKALTAAHDRYGKSATIKLLRLPGLEKGGDVADWLEAGGENTKEKLLELVAADSLTEWFPQESVRERVANQEMTGLAYEHNDPRTIFLDWLEIFHPPEEGPLHFYDDAWLKGVPKTLLYKFISENQLSEEQTQFLIYCYDRKSKNSDDPFKPTPWDVAQILKSGTFNRDLNVLENPSTPIFNPFFMSEKEKNYKPKDIVVMQNHNFYVPERRIFPRNMESCIALHALPFDYDENAKCPEIEKSFNTQWKDDKISINLFLQFLYYCMLHTHVYNTILCLIGESCSGKSKKLDLIRNFIGVEACEALSLGKIGRQFELYRARNAKLLICDDLAITKRDLSEGSIVENLKSIPSGGAIRIEKKSGDILSRVLACQIIMAGNTPPLIPELSNALANRFKFLVFNHIYVRGHDMNPLIIDEWVKELPGLMNLVLNSGPALIANDGFIESKSAATIRSTFEGGGSPAKKFILDWFDVNSTRDTIKWNIRLGDVRHYYDEYIEEEGGDKLPLSKLIAGIESILGIRRDKINIKITMKNGSIKWKAVKCWVGLRRKGTSGIITDVKNEPAGQNEQNEPAF